MKLSFKEYLRNKECFLLGAFFFFLLHSSYSMFGTLILLDMRKYYADLSHNCNKQGVVRLGDSLISESMK